MSFVNCCCLYLLVGMLVYSWFSKVVDEIAAQVAQERAWSGLKARMTVLVLLMLLWPKVVYDVYLK